MKLTLLYIFSAIAISFSNVGCTNSFFDFNTTQGRENISITLKTSSFFAFNEFLKSQDDEASKLANKVHFAALRIIIIDTNNTNLISEVTNIILEIDEDFEPELRMVAENISIIISNQVNIVKLEDHFFLLQAIADGALMASKPYLLNGSK